MSQENVELVLRSMAHQRAGRVNDWTKTICPGIRWDISAYPLPDFPDTGTGRDVFLRHMGEYFAGWNDYESSIDEAIDAGDDVVVILHERARMGLSDVILERRLAITWTVEGKALAFFRVFETREQALKAVGLEG
jgi:hypothetical protein